MFSFTSRGGPPPASLSPAGWRASKVGVARRTAAAAPEGGVLVPGVGEGCGVRVHTGLLYAGDNAPLQTGAVRHRVVVSGFPHSARPSRHVKGPVRACRPSSPA